MKHHIYSSLVLLLLLAGFRAEAQDMKRYSFAIESTGQQITYSQGNLDMADAYTGANSLAQGFIVKRLMADAYTGANSLAQGFIVKRLNDGKVLIAAAANSGLLIKRDGSAIVLAAYVANDSNFEWELVYSGYPYLSIAEPGANSFLSWQSGSGFSMVSPTALSSNSDSAGDHYRFALSNVANTF